MLVADDELLGEFWFGESGGKVFTFFPAGHGEETAVVHLAVELVVELFFLVNLSVMNMDGRKEKLLRVASGKGEGHRMCFVLAFAEFEYSEAVIGIEWDLVPSCFWDAEAWVQAIKVGTSGNERCFKVADLLDL